jgi:multidrug efflux pump subunit AcrB
MFGLIVVLGMIVDDAIVVAENIYTHFTETGDVIKSTIEGTSEVTWPVISSVSTTMIAFAPLLFVPGTMGKFFQLLPVIVIIALGISTLECFIMLPAHLSNSLFKYKRKVKKNKVLQKIRDDLKQILIKINSGFYEPILRMSLKNRYITLSIILAMLFISLGLIKGGILKFTFFPKFDADFINITVELPQGTAKNITMHAVNQIIDEIPSLDKYYKDSVLISEKLVKGHLIHFEDSHKVNVMIELVSAEKRTVTSSEIEVQLRKFVKQIPEAVSVKFGLLKIGPGGKPIQIEIVSENLNELKIVSEKIKKELYKYDGLYDIDLNVRPGKEEIKFKLKPLAKQLNLDLYDVANQIRTAFYGATAVKIQRGKDDIDVKVKYPRNKRTSFSNLKELRIRTKTGVEVPLMQVAEYYIERGYSTIERKNRNRYIYVESNIDESKANAEEILQDIDKNYLPKLRSRHHNVKIRFGGSNENTNESVGSLIKSYPIAMLLIFAILATLFDSYFKPLIVMAAIPFGLIGAAMGHLIMGYDITLISLFGIVALSGIVVNDSLILIDFILRSKLRSQNLYEAVVQSGVRRFRPIILTSVTTIFGLAPMMFEKSTQAKFLIPMAISISYGLLFATVLTLVFIPSLYLIYNDVSRLIIKIFKRKHLTPEQTEVYYELH